MQVRKRDGRVIDFEKKKIANAILAAMRECEKENERTAARIANEISKIEKDIIDIEEIQDIVEEKLMASSMKDVAKAYILYREERNRERNKRTTLVKEIGEKFSATNVQNSNANMDEKSYGGMKGAAADVLAKDYALNFCMSEMARNNHLNNEIYTHDLDNYAVGNHNCLTIPFDDLLANGFNTRQTDIRSANSINTAFQLLAVIFQLQSLQQFGGCSASHIDHTMVPYVRKSFYKHYKDGIKYLGRWRYDKTFVFDSSISTNQHVIYLDINDSLSIDDKKYLEYKDIYSYAMDMTLKETQQAVEGMFHNLNTLQSRSGCQLPFTSINFGTCTLPEGRMITKAILEGSLKGVGKLGRTAIFPCTIFQYDKEINGLPGTPNYDLFQLALKSTSKRLYPNYVNCGWSNNTGVEPGNPLTYASTMGCRTWNSEDANGLGATKDGRGNIAPVTIILPTLAMEAKEKLINTYGNSNFDTDELIDEFMRILDVKIHEAKDQLIERFTYICSHSADAAKFMYENNVMYGYVPEEGIISALKHGTLAIGQIALAETLQILLGCNHTNPEGLEVAKMIEQLFKDRCAEFKKEWYTFEFEGFPPTTCHLNFGVYYTPAESLCYTAMTKFKKKYGIIPNVSDKSFFTNSIHVPVWEHLNPLDKIKIESQLTGYSSAGCITYVELDSNCEDNLKALESLVSGAMDYDIPYFAINVPSDTCLDCGYTNEFDDKCPICGSTNLQHLRRVTGYLTGNYTTAFNLGKQEEVKLRYRHSKDWNEWKQQ